MIREPLWIDLLQFVTDTEGTEYRIRARVRDDAEIHLEKRNGDGEFHIAHHNGAKVKLWLPDGLKGEKAADNVRRWVAWVRRFCEDIEVLRQENERRVPFIEEQERRKAEREVYEWQELGEQLKDIRPATFDTEYKEARPKPEDGEEA